MSVALCECGCGEAAPIAKRSYTRKGHVKGMPVRFVNGHSARGLTRSEETRQKMASAKIGNRYGAGPKEVSDDAGYTAIHHWLNRRHPKAGRCDDCGAIGKTDYAFLRHPEPYTRVRADYAELCRGCHMKQDGRYERMRSEIPSLGGKAVHGKRVDAA